MQTPGQCLERGEQVFTTTAHASRLPLCARRGPCACAQGRTGSSVERARGGAQHRWAGRCHQETPVHLATDWGEHSGRDCHLWGSSCPGEGSLGADLGLVGKTEASVGQMNWNPEPAGHPWVCLSSCLVTATFRKW